MIHFAANMPVNLTSEQMGKLLFKAIHEPRRNLKRFLHDLGGAGSAEELDEALATAANDKEATVIANTLNERRWQESMCIEDRIDDDLVRMMQEISQKMKEKGISQSDLAILCGIHQPTLSKYLSGKKEPGVRNLTRMARSVGCFWKLSELTSKAVDC